MTALRFDDMNLVRQRIAKELPREGMSATYIKHLLKLLAKAKARVANVETLLEAKCPHPLEEIVCITVYEDDKWRDRYRCALCKREIR